MGLFDIISLRAFDWLITFILLLTEQRHLLSAKEIDPFVEH